MSTRKYYTSTQIADWIIEYTYKNKRDLTPTRIQQLLYYCQVWHLVQFKYPLFLQDIQAWGRGPIVLDQYLRFSSTNRNSVLNIDISTLQVPDLDVQRQNLIKNVVECYMDRSALLIEMHIFSEEPFKKARANSEYGEKGDNIISYEDIMAYYNSDGDELFSL